MKLIFKWSPRNKKFVSHNEVRVYFHDTLVDLHIPGAAMRAANLVLVRGSLTSRVWILHTQHTYRLNTWMHTWNGFVPFANQANEHTQYKLCMVSSVCVCVLSQKSVFPGIIAVIPFLTLNISFIEAPWVVTNLEILLPFSVLSSSASISLSLLSN